VILGVAGSSPVTHPTWRGPGQATDQGLSRSGAARHGNRGTPYVNVVRLNLALTDWAGPAGFCIRRR
jgi:hypothetical protein